MYKGAYWVESRGGEGLSRYGDSVGKESAEVQEVGDGSQTWLRMVIIITIGT